MTTEESRTARVRQLAGWSAAERSGHIIRCIAAELTTHRRGRAIEPTLLDVYQLIEDWQRSNSLAEMAESEVA